MASGKETPRQKMIGLMYLVLMALLAMNVSKDVLNAFVTVNSSLLKTNENASIQNELLFDDIKNAYAFDNKKTEKQMRNAEQIREKTSVLLSSIKELKVEVLAATENISLKVADTMQMKNISNKDNYDIPTYMMVGEKEDGSKGKAREIYNQIESYKNEITQLFNANEQTNLNLGLELEGGIQDDVKLGWEAYTFDHAPLVAAITILSKLENDIRNAEYTALSKLYASIGKDDFPFDTIAAKVVASSNYVLLGEDYQADVFLAAFSTTQKPEITLNEQELDVQNGVGNYNVKTDKEGLFSYNGNIKVKKKNGEEKDYPFQADYLVARPSLTVSPIKMNVLYKGIGNPISVSVPGIPNEKISISSTNGKLKKTGDGTYEITPEKSGSLEKTTIQVYADTKNGTKKSMGTMEFRLKRIPNPKVRIMGKTAENFIFSKTEIQRMTQINVEYGEDFMFNGSAKILSFSLELPPKGPNAPKTIKINGNRLTDEAKTSISKVNSGSSITLRDVVALGMDGTKRNLDPIPVKIK